MSQNLRDYTKTLYTLDAVVKRVGEGQWDQQSPNDEWTARETLGHVIWGLRRITAAIRGEGTPAEQPEAVVAGDTPAETWSDAMDKMFAALDARGVLDKEIDTPFGTMTVDDAIGNLLMDPLTHAWDIAKTVGIDAAIPDELAERSLGVLNALGDAIRGPGLFDDAVDVEQDAPVVDRLVAFTGRKP